METRTKPRSSLEIMQTLQIGSARHQVDIVRKKKPRGKKGSKYDHRWFMKSEFKYLEPEFEVVGQEIFRLFNPQQPKTRLVMNNPQQVGRARYWVISKEIEGFCPFEKIGVEVLRDGIKAGRYKGLGGVLVTAMLTGENDLHTENIGVDKKGGIVKIDGGYLFHFTYCINTDALTQLPLLQKYPVNWLQIAAYSKNEKKSKIDESQAESWNEIAGLASFRREVNEALMKMLVMPDWVDKFVATYVPEGATRADIVTKLHRNLIQFRLSAVNITGFKIYMQSEQAKADFADFRAYLTDFKTMGKNRLFDDEDLKQMDKRFNELHKDAAPDLLERVSFSLGYR